MSKHPITKEEMISAVENAIRHAHEELMRTMDTENINVLALLEIREWLEKL